MKDKNRKQNVSTGSVKVPLKGMLVCYTETYETKKAQLKKIDMKRIRNAAILYVCA